MSVEYSISLYDLERLGYIVDVLELEEVKEHSVCMIKAVTKDTDAVTMSEFDNILFQLGMDSRRGYQLTEYIHHVALDGNIVYFRRITGLERSDKKWIDSGHASDEVKMTKSKMKDMSIAVRRLGK